MPATTSRTIDDSCHYRPRSEAISYARGVRAAQREDEGVHRTRIAIPCVGRGNLQAQISTLRLPRLLRGSDGGRSGNQVRRINSDWKTLAMHRIRESARTATRQFDSRRKDGGRRLGGCQKTWDGGQMGITGTVAEAVDSYLKGETVPLGEDAFCRCGPRCS
jgi:hypothetical protein